MTGITAVIRNTIHHTSRFFLFLLAILLFISDSIVDASKCFDTKDELEYAISEYFSSFCDTPECDIILQYGLINTWCVSKVTDMSFLFYVINFKEADDISDWNVSSITTMNSKFSSSSYFNSSLSKWDVSSIFDMS